MSKNKKGFTMLEVVLTVLIGGILTQCCWSLLLAAQKTYQQEEKSLFYLENEVALLAIISREIREAEEYCVVDAERLDLLLPRVRGEEVFDHRQYYYLSYAFDQEENEIQRSKQIIAPENFQGTTYYQPIVSDVKTFQVKEKEGCIWVGFSCGEGGANEISLETQIAVP